MSDETPVNFLLVTFRLHPGKLLENGPGLKMCFLLKNGDIPASYVSVPEGNHETGRYNPQEDPQFSHCSPWFLAFAQVDGLEI